MSGNKRGARYLPFTCCTCVFLPLHGMQQRAETLLSEAQLLDISFASSRVSSRFLRASSLCQSRRVSLQPPIREYRILESDLPSICSRGEIPTQSEFIPRRGKTNGCLSACPTAAKYVSRSPPDWNPGVSKSTRDTSRGHLFWAAGIDRSCGQFRFVCLSLAEGDIGDRLYTRILNLTWGRFIFIVRRTVEYIETISIVSFRYLYIIK